MGVNYLEFLIEAFRVTRKGGYLIIAEVSSRMENIQAFIKLVELVGYKMKTKVSVLFMDTGSTERILHHFGVPEDHPEGYDRLGVEGQRVTRQHFGS